MYMNIILLDLRNHQGSFSRLYFFARHRCLRLLIELSIGRISHFNLSPS